MSTPGDALNPKQASYGATDTAAKEDLEDPIVTPEIDPALVCTGKDGLSTSEARSRLQRFGPNELPEKEDNKFVKFLLEFLEPMPVIIWIAIGIELLEYSVHPNPTKIMDAGVLLILQLLNVVVGFIEELKAGEEIKALRASLKLEATVVRNGTAATISASDIVPGDRVVLAAGAAVPADCMIEQGEKPIQVDQAAMTGESLPVTMKEGNMAKMGSMVTRGESEAIVHFTGADTFLGRTAALINTVDDQPNFEKVLQGLLIILVASGLVVCIIIFIYLKSEQAESFEVLSFCVVLLIASIPVALRVVCTCTLALGCKELAEEKAIVARLSSVEEFAGMDILCSDKTGTLTLNKMMLQEEMPLFHTANRDDVLKLAALAAKWWEPPKDALDTLVLGAVDLKSLEGYTQKDYTPFDPSLKRTEATIVDPQGKIMRVMKGACDVVLGLCDGNCEKVRKDVESQVLSFAMRGVRCLAVAKADDLEPYMFLGILTFLDPPRPDTKLTVEKSRELGVTVKMITGDHRAIAVETSRVLGLGTLIENTQNLPSLSIEAMRQGVDLTEYGAQFELVDGFAQVFPEHKYLIVEAYRQRGHLVGMTGDGVNDAPALKRADVGIAVCGATSAAQAASDIVLTQPGLSTIVSALFTSRKIFQRMKNFVIYRVACTQQLLLFFFFSCVFIDPDKVSCGFGQTYFTIPVVALVSITILNDGTIISVAYDHVEASAVPEKWNMAALYTVSTAIGLSALLGSLLLLHMTLRANCADGHWQATLGLPQLSYSQVQTVMYLKISLSDYASVFNSRCQEWMWSRAPSAIVFMSAAFAMVLATILSCYLPPDMEAIPGHVAAFVWLYVAVWAIIQDIVKVATYGAMRKMGMDSTQAVIAEESILSFKQAAQEAANDMASV